MGASGMDPVCWPPRRGLDFGGHAWNSSVRHVGLARGQTTGLGRSGLDAWPEAAKLRRRRHAGRRLSLTVRFAINVKAGLAQGLSFLVGSFDIEVTQVALSHSGLRRLRPCAKEGFTFLQSRRTRG